MSFLRFLLFPFSLVYWVISLIYHWAYNSGILKSRKFQIPVISVGNLTTGGTGKTPHVAYIIKLLLRNEEGFFDRIATLSRGYGRVTSGFILVDEDATAVEVGDEPRMLKQRFNNIFVAVDGNRAHGIDKLLSMVPGLNVIILDDAFQHRRVKPGLSILLQDFQGSPNTKIMLPAGDLREPRKGAKRADIIVVTNSPTMLSPHERRRINKIIEPTASQSVYFSYVGYDDLIPLLGNRANKMVSKDYYFNRNYSILLVTGIADPGPLTEYYTNKVSELVHISFPDHHEFTLEDIRRVQKKFDNIVNENKIILTTEKDAMRLIIPGVAKELRDLPVFYLPINIRFHGDDGENFNKQIIDYVTKN